MRGEFPFAALVPRRSALGALRNTSIAQGTLRDPIVIRPRDARRAHDHFSHTVRGRCKALPRPPICVCTHTTHALSSHKKQATRCLQYRSTLTHHTSHDHAKTAPQLTALHALDQSSRQVYSPHRPHHHHYHRSTPCSAPPSSHSPVCGVVLRPQPHETHRRWRRGLFPSHLYIKKAEPATDPTRESKLGRAVRWSASNVGETCS